jgi:DNA (cytosine-5)-methyltransferase 1
MLSSAIAANILIELVSTCPSQQELEDSPAPIEKPVSSSYSSVIAGIKARGRVTNK